MLGLSTDFADYADSRSRRKESQTRCTTGMGCLLNRCNLCNLWITSLADNDVGIGALNNGFQLALLRGGNFELVERLLQVIHESVPLVGRDVQVLMRFEHRASRIFLRTARCPADHFGNEILETSCRYLVVSFVNGRVRIQAGVGHDPVYKIIDHDSDVVDSAQPLIKAGLWLWLWLGGRHVCLLSIVGFFNNERCPGRQR